MLMSKQTNLKYYQVEITLYTLNNISNYTLHPNIQNTQLSLIFMNY